MATELKVRRIALALPLHVGAAKVAFEGPHTGKLKICLVWMERIVSKKLACRIRCDRGSCRNRSAEECAPCADRPSFSSLILALA